MRLYTEMKETVVRRLTTFPKVAGMILGSDWVTLLSNLKNPWQ